MPMVIVDARDLVRFMEHKGMHPDSLLGSVSRYLGNAYAIPTFYKTGYPAHQRTLSTQDLDLFFQGINLDMILDYLKQESSTDIQGVSLELDRNYLYITIKD